MSNDEFSSVEWLYDKIILKLYKLQKIEYTHIFLEELEQAKAMHKEEIKDAFTNGFISSRGSNRIADEIFYNETFGDNNDI